MIGYLFIRIGRYHRLFTEKVDLNVATPVFIDSIDEEESKNQSDSEKLGK